MPEAWAVRASIAGVPFLPSCSCPDRLIVHAGGLHESQPLPVLAGSVQAHKQAGRTSTKQGSCYGASWPFVGCEFSTAKCSEGASVANIFSEMCISLAGI